MIKESKKNQTFVYLYALAILMVIDDHCSTRAQILSGIFPYNTFYMPLFVFASGYFFKQTKLRDGIVHKIKRLYIPYIVYALIFWAIAAVIDFIFGMRWVPEINMYTLRTLVFEAPITYLNGASWFVVMLFWVTVIYMCIRTVLKTNKLTDYILTVLFVIGGCVGIYMCLVYNPLSFVIRFPAKMLFYIQFYHLGYMFRTYWECLLQKVRKLYVCIFVVLVHSILNIYFGVGIEFYSTEAMTGFWNVYLPVITSVLGITFWYEVMEFLAEKIGEVRIVSFIARNTFVIMQVHLFFICIPKMYCMIQCRRGVERFADFPVDEFMTSAWARYDYATGLASFLFGVAGSLMVAYVIEQVKNKGHK
ncbi:MAG: acyltransferase [Lachnospiraceae bacterium]|nr:acyltransferase [Lachnospiraceae bacterium]